MRERSSQVSLTDYLSRNPVRHLLVDLDGTLLGNRTLPLSVDFVRRSFKLLRRHGSARTIARALLGVQREFRRPSSDLPNDHRVVELFSRQMNVSVEEGREILREGVLLIFPELRRHFYPIQGAKEFLDWAKGRYPLTLATNPVWPPEVIELRVKWAGIDPSVFGFVTHIRQMRACKPSARYYEDVLALQRLLPAECLLIGDNLKMDLPATRVGIPVFILGGPTTRLGSLRHPGACAPAWRGNYRQLQDALEQARVAAQVPS